MFEAATIRQSRREDGRYDVGRLLDAMLYYDRVHVILDPNSYLSIVAQLGVGATGVLLRHHSLVVSLIPELAVIRRNEANGVSVYLPQFVQWAGTESSPVHPDDTIGVICAQMRRRGDQVSRRQIEMTLAKAKKTKLPKILGESYSLDGYNSLLNDLDSLKLFVAAVAHAFGWRLDGGALHTLKVEVVGVGGGAFIHSEPGLDVLFPDGVVNDWGLILNAMNDYGIELHLAQAFSSDLICSTASAQIAEKRIDLSLQRAARSAEAIEAFEGATFHEARLLARAYNDGRLTVGGALNLIDRARPMREWLRGLPPNVQVFDEYQSALAKEEMFQGLPATTARFALFTGVAAALSPLAAIGLSAFDTFVVGKLLQGWRPNFFVRDVREFIPQKD